MSIAPHSLSLSNVSLSYGGLDILKQVSFDVSPNEVVGLIGPNGAGKSALLNCISRVYHPSPGADIAINGIGGFLRTPAHAIARHGMSRTFQGLQFSPQLTIAQNIAVGLSSQLRHGSAHSLLRPRRFAREEAHARDAVRRIAGACGITDVLGKYPGQLPLGILRRADLARALVSSPSVLLLDEPASGLAREERPLIADLIRVAREEHAVAVIWVEHDLDLVFANADRVVVLRNGAVASIARPAITHEREQLISAYYH